jgi:hypothetical protein
MLKKKRTINPNNKPGRKKGTKISEETKKKISEIQKIHSPLYSEKIFCVYCKEEFFKGNYLNFHGENCKFKWIGESIKLKKRR